MIGALLLTTFISFQNIPAEELVPVGSELGVAEDGTLTVNGENRFLIGTVYGPDVGRERDEDEPEAEPDTREPAWIYRGALQFADAERLGIDAFGFEAGRGWMRAITDYGGSDGLFFGAFPSSKDFRRVSAGQLGAYVTFPATIAAHGGILPGRDAKIPPSAYAAGICTNLPYSLVNDYGKKIWMTMWKDSAEEYSSLSPVPFCFELFSEPRLIDQSAVTRRLLSSEIPAFGKGVPYESLSLADRIKVVEFSEKALSSIARRASMRLKSIDSDFRVTVRPASGHAPGCDPYLLSRELDVIGVSSSATLAETLTAVALARKKPVVIGSLPLKDDPTAVRAAVVTAWMRGVDAVYLSEWNPTPRLSPESLKALRKAKRDILSFGRFFTRRDRGVSHPVAVLRSQATERILLARGEEGNLLFDRTVEELNALGFDPVVITEEQLVASPKEIEDVRLLMVPGAIAVYPLVRKRLTDWAKEGRIAALVGGRLDMTDRGAKTVPLDATAASGDGGVIYIPTNGMTVASFRGRLRTLADSADVTPAATVRGAEKIELARAADGGDEAWVLVSREPESVEVRFSTRGGLSGRRVLSSAHEEGENAELVELETEHPLEHGVVTLTLRPNDPVLLKIVGNLASQGAYSVREKNEKEGGEKYVIDF